MILANVESGIELDYDLASRSLIGWTIAPLEYRAWVVLLECCAVYRFSSLVFDVSARLYEHSERQMCQKLSNHLTTISAPAKSIILFNPANHGQDPDAPMQRVTT